MTRGRYITKWLALAALGAVAALPLPLLAQQRGQHQPPRQQTVPRQQPGTRAQQPHPHAGDWLRQYKDLPPAEQDRALQNDPWFNRLPPGRQQKLRERLQNFSSLPPQRQLRVLNRMDTWEHLTPEQKQQARQMFGQMQQLPVDRRRLVHKAIDDL